MPGRQSEVSCGRALAGHRIASGFDYRRVHQVKNMLEINPDKLGNLEVEFWKAHNNHDEPGVFEFLVKYNMSFYGFTEAEANNSVQHLITAVRYHDKKEWVKATEEVEKYYQNLKSKTLLQFNPKQMAELEVGWWHLHDKLEHDPDKSSLAKAFSKLYATQFDIKEEKMSEAGRLKAEATREHDVAEDYNTPTNKVDKHWNNAERLLIEFYTELQRVTG